MTEIDLSSPLNYGTPSSMMSVRSGLQGTPIRMRPNIHAERRIRTVNIGSDPAVPTVRISKKVVWSIITHLLLSESVTFISEQVDDPIRSKKRKKYIIYFQVL